MTVKWCDFIPIWMIVYGPRRITATKNFKITRKSSYVKTKEACCPHHILSVAFLAQGWGVGKGYPLFFLAGGGVKQGVPRPTPGQGVGVGQMVSYLGHGRGMGWGYPGSGPWTDIRTSAIKIDTLVVLLQQYNSSILWFCAKSIWINCVHLPRFGFDDNRKAIKGFYKVSLKGTNLPNFCVRLLSSAYNYRQITGTLEVNYRIHSFCLAN